MRSSLKEHRGASGSHRTVIVGVALLLSAISLVLLPHRRGTERAALDDGHGNSHDVLDDAILPQLLPVDGLELISRNDTEVQRQSEGACRLERILSDSLNHPNARAPFVVSQCIASCAQGSDCAFAFMALSRASLRSQHLAASSVPVFSHEDHNAHVSVVWCLALRCSARFTLFHRLLRRRNEFPAGDPVRAYVSAKVTSAADWSCCVKTDVDHDRRSSNDDMHVLVMSAPQHIRERLLPGLRTWLRDRRATIFLDDVGDGQESRDDDDKEKTLRAHNSAWQQSLSDLREIAARRNRDAGCHSENTAPLRAAVSPPCRRLDVQLLFPTSARSLAPARRSINGAWKPLVLLAFAYSRIVSPRESPPSWFALVDDDTFVHWPNLMCHLSLIVAHSGDPRSTPMVAGSMQTFHGIFHQKEFLHRGRNDNSSAPSTFLAPKFQAVRYPQGGGGMVLSAAAVRDLNICLRRLNIFFHRHCLCSPENSSLCDEWDSFEFQSLSWLEESSGAREHIDSAVHAGTSAKQHVVSIATGFADLWPAGDMRLGWAVSECNRFLPYTGRQVPTSMIHVSAMFHRTLELTVGADRRHWASTNPVSFHRLRTADDFARMDFVFRSALHPQCPTASWRSVEDRLATWWKLHAGGRVSANGNSTRHDEEVKAQRAAFFDDDGYF